MNQLTSVIPESMTSLNSLSFLHVSYNNLSGRIPRSARFQNLTALNFIGNHDLCGPPLTASCSGDDTPLEPIPAVNGGEGGADREGIGMKWYLYVTIPLAFVVGF